MQKKCVIKLEFKCNDGVGALTALEVEYIFGNDEYYKYVDSDFNSEMF